MSAGRLAVPAHDGAATMNQPRVSRWAVLAVVTLTVGLVIATLALLANTPDVDADVDGWRVQLAADVFAIVVGLIAWWARPGNRVGPLLILYGFANPISFLSLSRGSRIYASLCTGPI